MKKALIVEDELLARVGIRSLINWEELGITLLEDAQDGREALNQIEKEHPDIMLLDLNIPEISGLELLRVIKKKNLRIKTIVVSCYDDFDTVKEAMKLGAVDYIRKFGLSKEELVTSLTNLMELPPEEPNEIRKSAAQIHMELTKKIQNIPKEYQNGWCLSFYMFWKHTQEMTEMKIVETIADQYFQTIGIEFMSFMYEGKLLILMKQEVTREAVEQMMMKIHPFLSNPCYVGITPYQNCESQFLVRIANTIENYGFYGLGEEIAYLDLPVSLQKTYPFDISVYMEKLERGIKKISEEDIMNTLEELFEQILQYKYLSVTLVKKLMIEIISCFSAKAGQLGGAIEEIEVFDSYKHYQKMVQMTSFDEMKHWWSEFVHQFSLLFFTSQKRAESDIIHSTLEYIDTHLNQVIQLSDVAKYIGVSEPYLSSFFKKSMNENFIPYVNRQKIKKAKQLLMEGKMVYQVSDLLGYENSTYFSKVFKKMEGVTPEQYKKSLSVSKLP